MTASVRLPVRTGSGSASATDADETRETAEQQPGGGRQRDLGAGIRREDQIAVGGELDHADLIEAGLIAGCAARRRDHVEVGRVAEVVFEEAGAVPRRRVLAARAGRTPETAA